MSLMKSGAAAAAWMATAARAVKREQWAMAGTFEMGNYGFIYKMRMGERQGKGFFLKKSLTIGYEHFPGYFAKHQNFLRFGS